jgi:hypothetical protein
MEKVIETGGAAEGMTLRDYFAAKAMAGLLAADVESEGTPASFWKAGKPEVLKVANYAYLFADAMIRAR